MGVCWRSLQGDAGADASVLTALRRTVHHRGVALSVDLAYVDYRDIGVALVTCDSNGAEESLSARAFDVPLSGRPSVTALATWLREMVEAHDVRCLCIDGPLGWRSPHTDSPHCRLSERAVRAPGKTGLPPDGVKPRTYLGFTTFSIALFEAFLGSTDWALPGDPEAASHARVVTESFPTAGWRALGPPLEVGTSHLVFEEFGFFQNLLEPRLGQWRNGFFGINGSPTPGLLQVAEHG